MDWPTHPHLSLYHLPLPHSCCTYCHYRATAVFYLLRTRLHPYHGIFHSPVYSVGMPPATGSSQIHEEKRRSQNYRPSDDDTPLPHQFALQHQRQVQFLDLSK